MKTHAQALVDQYVAVWNEPDNDARRESIRQLWVPEGRHFVGARQVHGYRDLEDRITASHHKNVRDAGYKFVATANMQTLHDTVMFNWQMVDGDTGTVTADGLEFLQVDNEGRILSDYQFILPSTTKNTARRS